MTSRLPLLKELRDRVAKATGPDRELDVDLACALCGFERRGRYEVRPVGRIWWSDTLHEIKPLTGSVDAANALMPDGAWKEVSGPRKYLNIPTYSPNYWRCNMTVWDSPTSDRNFDGWGATEPLSIIDARLRYEIATAEATEKAAG